MARRGVAGAAGGGVYTGMLGYGATRGGRGCLLLEENCDVSSPSTYCWNHSKLHCVTTEFPINVEECVCLQSLI